MNNFISRERDSGRNVYSISLGDSGWEQFWAANSFGLTDAVDCLGAIDCPTFHTIGNHDNNPYISDDWGSSEIFRKNVAPSYYSFNIGDVHFVILDNIIYNNPGATSSTMGERTYDRALTDRQLAWLREDLTAVSDKSAPLVICGHVPFYADPRLSGQTATTTRNMLNMDDLEDIIRPFSNVTLFSGHYHRNYTVASPYLDGVTEHNVASLSGSLWWTAKSGYSDNHICTDGSPGGYGILRVDNSTLDYSYKGAGFDESYQFRVYDLNTVRIDEDKVSGKTKYKNLVRDYADVYYYGSTSDEILVNVFSWQPGWDIRIEEEGVILPVTRVRTKDPLHILSYECQRLSHNAVPSQTSTLLTQ
ncbi:MAG: calcineurin-like phosphoesterase C-terminal domain-containing protein, partial [Muribaculaceae bacterium]|nr:calcineurin-like phosphoesterase C-terminal domain-containing protein [Muribaculaceae bacterium]